MRYYTETLEQLRRQRGQRLPFSTAQGRQVAFFVPPAAPEAKNYPVWVVFGGNAMLALDWADMLVRRGSRGRCSRARMPSPRSAAPTATC